MNFRGWMLEVPTEITGDPLWKTQVYPLALFVADIGWRDATKLMQDRRALGSIGANVSEGYSRSGGKDRARFLEYALGSARESRGWYFKGRHILGKSVAEHRIRLLTQIIRLLITMIPDQRESTLRDQAPPYRTGNDSDDTPLPGLLENVPFAD